MIVDLITKSQHGNGDATIELINKFNPVLKKYAWQLHYDDAYDDLLVSFVQLIHGINLNKIHNRCEGCLVSYISKTVKSIYIKKSKQRKPLQKTICYSQLNSRQLYSIESISSMEDTYFRYKLPDIEPILTKPEITVIEMVYIFGYSISETAKRLHVSRQAVNQMKKRSLQKIKANILDKP